MPAKKPTTLRQATWLVLFGVALAIVCCEISFRAFILLTKPLTIPGVFENEFYPNGSGLYSGAWVTLDKFGFRNGAHKEAWTKPEKILLIGDSVCFGQGVDDEYTIAHLMNLKLSETNMGVIDLCHPGWDTPKIRSRLLREGNAHGKIVHIFWLYYINDAKSSTDYFSLEDISTLRPFPIEIRALFTFNRYFKFPFLIKSRLAEYQKKLAIESPGNTWEAYYRRCLDAYQIGSATRVNEEKYIADIAHWSNEHAIPIDLVALPAKDQLTDDERGPQEFLTLMAERYKLQMYDMLPKYRQEQAREEIFLPQDQAHLNRVGTKLISSTLVELIKAKYHDSK